MLDEDHIEILKRIDECVNQVATFHPQVLSHKLTHIVTAYLVKRYEESSICRQSVHTLVNAFGVSPACKFICSSILIENLCSDPKVAFFKGGKILGDILEEVLAGETLADCEDLML
mmetsp:Transcript_17486/g.26952  ORF Transcript_17486/g.26952 Transcript_17486/m.26952 type:complete len:116 (+) Transcript_17486:898-1245(+)